MAGSAVTFLSITLAYVIIRLRVARKIIGFLSVTDTYIHTYIQTISEMRRRISCLALRCSANMHSLIKVFTAPNCRAASLHVPHLLPEYDMLAPTALNKIFVCVTVVVRFSLQPFLPLNTLLFSFAHSLTDLYNYSIYCLYLLAFVGDSWSESIIRLFPSLLAFCNLHEKRYIANRIMK